jgi:hypothetical protein
MKKVVLSIIIVFLCILSFAQVPESFNYQAIPRNSSGAVYADQAMNLRTSILSGSPTGTSVYSETFAATTTSLGLINLQIGKGTPVSGSFTTINWGSGSYYLKVEIDPTGGTSYVAMGTTQLLSVPFALFAKKADGINGSITFSQVSDFQTGVTNNTAVLANTAKNNYPTADATKLAGIAEGAEVNVNADWNASGGDAQILNKPAVSVGTDPGDMQYWNGTAWLMVPVGQPGQILRLTTSNIPAWSGVAYPTLTTTDISSIEGGTALSGGNIISEGGAGGSVTARGVCWSLSANPTTANSITIDGTGTGTFTSSITGLTALTTYYVRAYATNSVGTAYGNELGFTTTSATEPVLTTTEVTSITSTDATSGGNISSDGGATVIARGVCWSADPIPTLSDDFTSNETGTGSFSSSITGLTPKTTYYVRAYATNSVGTTYGNELSFTTLGVPTVTTSTFTDVKGNSAKAGGIITFDGGSPITAEGLCWSTNPDPTTANNVNTSFADAMTGLSPNTLYYARAYASNIAGTGYGTEISFNSGYIIGSTYAGGLVFYNDGSGNGMVSANADQSTGAGWGCSGTTIGGTSTVINSGAANTTAIVAGCSTAGIAAEICDNLLLNGFSDWFLPSKDELYLMLWNLHYQGFGGFDESLYYWSSSEEDSDNAWMQSFYTGDQVYFGKGYLLYVRAIRAFPPSQVLPTITTTAISSIRGTTVTSGGDVLADGGATVTERGVFWSTDPNPTLSDSYTTDDSGTGSFPSEISGLTQGTVYYVRAYATNIAGTGYGNEISFNSGYEIGSAYAGGLVFYNDGTGSGLVCTATDQSTGAEWGCSGTIIGGTLEALNTGQANTNAIVTGCTTSGIAAEICKNLDLNSYTDWFLPSKDELNLMYSFLHTQSLGGFTNALYWSSTEDGSSYAWRQYFENGDQEYGPKAAIDYVRAVRSF